MEKRTYNPGEVIYREGDDSNTIYLIKSGKVELVDHYPETGDVVAQTVNAGKVFGEVELIDRRKRSSTARAKNEVKLTIFTQEEAMETVFSPENSLVMGRNVFDRLRDLYSTDSLDAEMTKLREEMHETIKAAVINHESRVVKSHNGMAAIAGPIIVLIGLVIGIRFYFQ
jgi:CRP/FNR family transcriptional regulator, cyclic AMP receptor protein